jgi:alkaline phosphatase D
MKTRRSFVRSAAAIGAVVAWGKPARLPAVKWRERRDLFPEGVASGDPDDKSVILWTWAGDASVGRLLVEVAEDEDFRKIVTTATAPVSQPPMELAACWPVD